MTVEDRIRRAASELRAQTERLPVPELEPRPGTARRRLVVALAATTALAVVAAMLAIVATRAGEVEPAGTGSWEKVPFEEAGLEPGAYVSSVARGGPGLVAVGTVHSSPSEVTSQEDRMSGRVWTSVDGRRWDAVAEDQFDDVLLRLVVDTPDGLLVFGNPMVGEHTSVWRSADGERWEVVTTEAPSLGHVVVGGPGLVAAGHEVGSEGGPRPAIWTSPDGSQWDRVPDGENRFPLGQVNGLARNDRGFLAVGFQFDYPDEHGRPIAWTSPDGVSWKRVRRGSGLPGTGNVGVPAVGTDSRFVIFRTEPAPATTCMEDTDVNAVFQSADGERWTRLSRVDLTIGGALHVVSAHERVLVAGSEHTCEASRAAVYISEDGRRWDVAVEDAPSEPGEFGFPLAMSATRTGALVLVGDVRQIFDGIVGPDVWLWTAP